MSNRDHIADTIRSVTDGWDEPLDDVHDIAPIVNALLANFEITNKEN